MSVCAIERCLEIECLVALASAATSSTSCETRCVAKRLGSPSWSANETDFPILGLINEEDTCEKSLPSSKRLRNSRRPLPAISAVPLCIESSERFLRARSNNCPWQNEARDARVGWDATATTEEMA